MFLFINEYNLGVWTALLLMTFFGYWTIKNQKKRYLSFLLPLCLVIALFGNGNVAATYETWTPLRPELSSFATDEQISNALHIAQSEPLLNALNAYVAQEEPTSCSIDTFLRLQITPIPFRSAQNTGFSATPPFPPDTIIFRATYERNVNQGLVILGIKELHPCMKQFDILAHNQLQNLVALELLQNHLSTERQIAMQHLRNGPYDPTSWTQNALRKQSVRQWKKEDQAEFNQLVKTLAEYETENHRDAGDD